MADDFDTQYREQTKRAERARATVKAWFDVWVKQPLGKSFSGVPRWFERFPKDWMLVVGLAFLIVFVSYLLITLGWPMYRRIYNGILDKNLVTGSDDFGRLATTGAALIGGAVGLVFLYWRTWLTQRQTHIANETLYTQLLTKAVEQLGATRENKETKKSEDADGKTKYETITNTVPNTAVRIGGIYALEKIAQDYPKLHWQIITILCAYVRETTGPARPETRKIAEIRNKEVADRTTEELALLAERDSAAKKPTIDVQTAINVIGRRPPDRRKWEAKMRRKDPLAFRLDLTNAHLAGINLDRLCLTAALLDGSCLESASVKHTILLETSLIETNFKDAEIRYADLRKSRLTLSDMTNASIESSYLEGANLDRAHLYCASLEGSNLIGASLMATNLDFAVLSQAEMKNASMKTTRMRQANLDGADLSNAVLSGANLRNASLDGTILRGTIIEDAVISGANLSRSIGLTSAQVAEAWGTFETILPIELNRPRNQRWLEARTSDETDEQFRTRYFHHPAAWH